MFIWKKVLNIVAGAGVLAALLVTSVAAHPAEASAAPLLDSCRSLHADTGRWSLDGRICWDLHGTFDHVAGPIRLQGSVEDMGHPVAVFVAAGDIEGDNLVAPGTPRWTIDDVSVTLTTPRSTRSQDLNRRFVGRSLEGAVDDFEHGVVRGIIGVLVALLLP